MSPNAIHRRSRLYVAQRLQRSLVCAVLLGALSACRTGDENIGRDVDAGKILDGMEIQATARSARESAREAMQKRDLQKLKMVQYYVQHRAQQSLFGEGDRALLDLGVFCLENGLATEGQVEKALAAPHDARLERQVRITCLGAP